MPNNKKHAVRRRPPPTMDEVVKRALSRQSARETTRSIRKEEADTEEAQKAWARGCLIESASITVGPNTKTWKNPQKPAEGIWQYKDKLYCTRCWKTRLPGADHVCPEFCYIPLSQW